MRLNINNADLLVNVQGTGTPIIAHHGAPGMSTHEEPKRAFGPLTDKHQLITFDARGSGSSEAKGPYTHECHTRALRHRKVHHGGRLVRWFPGA